MNKGCKLTAHHDLITVSIAYHQQNLCPEISALLQFSPFQRFLSMNYFFCICQPTPDQAVMFYTVWFGNENTAHRIPILKS